MPVLKNSRYERYAQSRAKGKSIDDAYVIAGFKQNRGNAARLNANESVQKRVEEITGKAAEKAGVTIQSLTDELDDIKKAAASAGQHSAALGAVMGKAKIHGFLIDKKRLEGPNGGPVQIDMSGYSLEQLRNFQDVLAQLAGASIGDAEAGESGDSEAGV